MHCQHCQIHRQFLYLLLFSRLLVGQIVNVQEIPRNLSHLSLNFFWIFLKWYFHIIYMASSCQIWSALDDLDYVGAVEFFFLGRHLSVKMQLTGEMLAAHVNARVLVKRQWAALDHIETTIASACRKQLANPVISNEVN